ncbi:MAG TPA: DNA recombination protein RmuC [Rhodospirillaceae bacterium]|nr:DNA recombination protein RmuC [Rhodospirillaceae bacterium]
MDSASLIPVATFAVGALAGSVLAYALLRGRGAAHTDMIDTFKALAADTLHQNSTAFLQMAEGKLQQREQAASATLDKKTVAIDAMIKPVQETLHKMDQQLQALEVKREGAYRELAEMVSASRETQIQLRQETSQLLQALRAPTGRGRWGELQLQRLLEMTGMSAHARDFSTQETVTGEEGEGAIRPDMIVALPGNRCVIIDSKVPLSAYLDFVQSGEESGRVAALKQHARHLKDHIKRLSNKAYWDKIDGTPEFVVLFLPGEHFLSAALDGDADLMEYSASNQVVLATPMTLIALLRTVAYGWRQEAMHQNVRKVGELGRTLHKALGTFAGQMDTLGSKIGGAVEAYNKTVRSLEKNVLSKARQLSDYGASDGETEIEEPALIEREPRVIMLDTTVKKIAASGE